MVRLFFYSMRCVETNFELLVSVVLLSYGQLKGSVKEPNIWIYFFFCPSLSGVLFPMFCLLVEGECQILVF